MESPLPIRTWVQDPLDVCNLRKKEEEEHTLHWMNDQFHRISTANPEDPLKTTDQTRRHGLLVSLLLTYCSQTNFAETFKFTMWKSPLHLAKNIRGF